MVVLGVLTGLLAWHTIYWHTNGTQKELFDAMGDNWWATAKGVGYNLGLMMERFTDLVGYKVSKIEHFATEEQSEPSDAGQEAASGTAKGEEAKASELVA